MRHGTPRYTQPTVQAIICINPCNKVCVPSYAKARATGFISTRKCVSRLQKCRQTIHIQAKCHTTPAPSQAAQYRISTSVSPAPTEHKKAGSEESCRVAALTAKGPTAMRTAQPHEPAARVLKHSMAVESPAQAHSLHKLSRHTNHAATAQTRDGSRHATAGNHKVASIAPAKRQAIWASDRAAFHSQDSFRHLGGSSTLLP